MNTKKILAVAAIALLSVPAYAAATQIVVGPLTEQVVEGHTVFAVIEKARFRNQTIEAAAVAVLVRERVQERENVKGVLWFNDQYLVSPSNIDSAFTRYPCGGAVIAVNAGDPDPRTMLVGYNDTDSYTNIMSANFGTSGDEQDVLSQDEDYSNFALFDDPPPSQGPLGTTPADSFFVDGPGVTHAETMNDAGTPGATTPGSFQPDGNAWVDVSDPDGLSNPTILPTVSTSTPTGLFNYEESYLITDPNDHTWIIDKYNGITVDSINLNTGDLVETTSLFPLWVVNILGKPVFTPDDGILSCSPFVDDPWQQAVINENFVIADELACDTTTAAGPPVPVTCPSSPPGLGVDVDGDGVPTDGLDAKPPAIGYFEPTQTGGADEGTVSYCYEGNAQPRPGEAARAPGSGCNHGMTYLPPPPDETLLFGFGNALDLGDRQGNHPLRLYNALLYFYTEDCETGSNIDDVRAVACFVPHNLDDTNGCQAGTEWHCPTWVFADTDGDGIPDSYVPGAEDDDLEGNSHPFNPPGLYVPAVFDPTTGTQVGGTGEWYDFWAINRACSTGYSDVDTDANGQPVCNRNEHIEHDRGLIDLYFSPSARPLEPPLRSFAELDYEGRIDEFHENNENPNANPGEPGHPGTPDNDLAPLGLRR